jgi:hypothetical protein
MKLAHLKGSVRAAADVRFGSKADIAAVKCDVRLRPKADIAERNQGVRFVPFPD